MIDFVGKVVLITGAARGQGRAHAVEFARRGADVIAVDLCDQVGSAPYPMSTPEDLEETVRLVEKVDRRIVARIADVRDTASITDAVAAGIGQLGRLDVVIANAGITGFAPALEMTDAQWNDMIDVNLTGVFKTLRAALPYVVAQGQGGSVVITSSAMGLKAGANLAHYSAAKHGLVGLARSFAIELAQHGIRVNTVHPAAVDTPMLQNDVTMHLFLPGIDDPTREQFAAVARNANLLATPWVETADVTSAVLWLASDEARFVTGVALPVDAGSTIK